MEAAVAGFALGLSLIIAIGAQNAFVLRQGLLGAHVFAVSLACALSDALLITAGVGGFGLIADAAPWTMVWMRWGGAAFLTVYGALALHSAWRGGHALRAAKATETGLAATLATCLALTWLNPHVYLDTVVLLGSVSADYPGLPFAAGAVTASFVFFFALGYGAALLRPIFARPAPWRVLDAGIAAVMWSIAASLILG